MAGGPGRDHRPLERALGLEDRSGETPAEAAERERLEMRLAPLAELLDPAAPDADLFDRIAARAGLDDPLAGLHVCRRDEGVWRRIADGVEVKTLWSSDLSRRRALLLRMAPGAVLPAHEHVSDEECFVLEGEIEVNGVAFRAGDFQVAFAATRHPAISSRTGCLVYIGVGT